MNFDLSEEQQVIADLATRIFEDLATPERVKAANEAGGFHDELWSALADAGIVGLSLPETVDGSGMGLTELALVLQQQGRRVAPVPLGPAVAAARTIAGYLPAESDLLADFVAGRAVVTAALAESGRNDPLAPTVTATSTNGGVRLAGFKPAVPGLAQARAVLVPARGAAGPVLTLVNTDAPGVQIHELATTNHESQANLAVDTVVATERLITDPSALDDLVWSTVVTNCAVQLGVAEGSLALVADHVATRHQFERPLAAFQAVSQRAADCYVTIEALRSTLLNAAWQYDHGTDPFPDILAAAYWAAEGTQQVVLAGQHLHGGVGSDTDHPVHRYFLWGMQYAAALGSSSAHLERLGRLIAEAAPGAS